MQKTEKENQEPAKFYPKGMADEDLLLRVEPVGPGNDEDSFFTILVSLTQTGEKYFNVHGIFEAANLLGGSVYGIPKFPRSIINEGQRPEDLFHRLVKKSYTRQ